jgi:hypothetical protein
MPEAVGRPAVAVPVNFQVKLLENDVEQVTTKIAIMTMPVAIREKLSQPSIKEC